MGGRVLYLVIVGLLGGCVHASPPSRVTQVSVNIVDEVVGRGPLRGRLAHDDAELVLYVAGEQDGVIGPCGCEEVPKGAMAQLVSYRDAAEEASSVTGLLINPGAYFETSVGLVSALVNTVMLDGLRYASWDALNVTAADLSFLRAHPDHGLPLVSANLNDSEGLEVPRIIEKSVGGSAILITGVSRPEIEYDTFTDPVIALKDVLGPISDEMFVVVLAHGLGKDIPEIMKVSGIDVVIDADEHVGHWPGISVDGVLWVRSRASAVTINELRLKLTDGALAHARLRTISMDEEIPGDETLLALAQSLQEALETVLEQ
jgi:hypothetical protein